MKRAAAKKTGRKPGQTSPRIARAARKNGAAGGRPRDRLPDAVKTALGDPPAETEALRAWNARLLAASIWLNANGEIGGELAATLRAGCAALERALPAPRRVESPDDEDDGGEDPDGPELENDDGVGSEPLHVGG